MIILVAILDKFVLSDGSQSLHLDVGLPVVEESIHSRVATKEPGRRHELEHSKMCVIPQVESHV